MAKVIILPKIWVDINGVEFGDKVDIIMETDGTLSVRVIDPTVKKS